jgi:hypothetical protein
MSEEQINIAIAEACGWVFKTNSPFVISPEGKELWDDDDPLTVEIALYWKRIPDYCNDLNAMHEAEKKLNGIKAAEYARIVTSIAWQSEQPSYAPITATARQRAEAFLKAIGKWEDGK